MAIELPDGRCESNEVLEALRLRAVHAREQGYAVTDIAAILGVREETVSRWCSRYDRGGREALPGDRTGRPLGSGRLLGTEQEQGIRQAIETKTPQELAIPSALWTRQAVRESIHQRVGIRLPIRTVGEYLRRWGYTPQKPVRKAYRQDPKAVAEWLEKTYPAIERRAAREGGEIHWGDETGVRSTCPHSRGYARPGATPELTVPGTRFSVNMISTVTNQGKVRWMIYPGRMNAALFLVFLTRLVVAAQSPAGCLGRRGCLPASRRRPGGACRTAGRSPSRTSGRRRSPRRHPTAPGRSRPTGPASRPRRPVPRRRSAPP